MIDISIIVFTYLYTVSIIVYEVKSNTRRNEIC